jgi:4,5-DOPA dioxygenase extradiol
MERFPAIFIGHGSPMQIPAGAPGTEFLRRLGAELGKPKAILIASAHWETEGPAVSGAEQPETIYDFGGFPPEFYRVRYPAPGAPDLARRVADLLGAAGMPARIDPTQGLDHGAWVPLRLMYPDADVPVAQLALQHHLGPAHHLAMGRALAPLRDEGVLILGAGNLTHNLGDAFRRMREGPNASTDAWAREFDRWVADAAIAGKVEDLVQYRTLAPHARMAHPRDEHYLPLLVAAGAGGEGARGRRLNDEFLLGNLSQAAYAFDAPDKLAA